MEEGRWRDGTPIGPSDIAFFSGRLGGGVVESLSRVANSPRARRCVDGTQPRPAPNCQLGTVNPATEDPEQSASTPH